MKMEAENVFILTKPIEKIINSNGKGNLANSQEHLKGFANSHLGNTIFNIGVPKDIALNVSITDNEIILSLSRRPNEELEDLNELVKKIKQIDLDSKIASISTANILGFAIYLSKNKETLAKVSNEIVKLM